MSHQELDLYGTGINWRKAISIVTVMSVIVGVVGFFGYRWLTSVTPVTRGQALQMFKEESRVADEAAAKEASDAKASGSRNAGEKSSGKDGNASDEGSKSTGSGGGGSSPEEDQTAVAAGTGSDESTATPAGKRSGSKDYKYPTTPDEGVYSWATEGWEEAAGIRRDFPKESQRIITASDGDSYKQHHYFSEEREIWSEFVTSDKGMHMASQRNRAKFGPVTNDSTIDFSPPMLVGLANPQVGQTWSGRWQGRTSGTYQARIFDHGKMTIGGESLEVWGYELRIEMRGELDGSVHARIMYSPEHALTVQEHYTQDIQSERGRYQAEWQMTLKSTTPQT